MYMYGQQKAVEIVLEEETVIGSDEKRLSTGSAIAFIKSQCIGACSFFMANQMTAVKTTDIILLWGKPIVVYLTFN